MIAKEKRYEGKPLLRLLECYVLKAINALSDEDKKNLEKIEPNLKSIYGIDGSWFTIIEKIMDLPPNFNQLIYKMWVKNYELAEQNGEVLTPQIFSEMFVDTNLVV